VDPLRLLNQFFQFSVRDWSLWGPQLSSSSGLERFFARPLFPPRTLRAPRPTCLQEAERIFWAIRNNCRQMESSAFHESDFPSCLFEHIPPDQLPPVLYRRGPWPFFPESICIVGTRRSSSEGEQWAKNFARFFLSAGFSLGSGLARGIDSFVHREEPKLTWAVLGGCLQEIYPSENRPLADLILESGGTLLSPFPPSSVPLQQNFPYRNRWLAALSAGTLVIEGSEKSGALVTGRWALAMGKPVIALSRNFNTELGRGALSLMNDGASLARDPQDALSQLWGAKPWPRRKP
jgi:DNA protecting protein DprA